LAAAVVNSADVASFASTQTRKCGHPQKAKDAGAGNKNHVKNAASCRTNCLCGALSVSFEKIAKTRNSLTCPRKICPHISIAALVWNLMIRLGGGLNKVTAK